MSGYGTRRQDRLRRADPRAIGRYRVLRRLGAGGMGVVYLAEAPSGRCVALKVVHEALAADPAFRRRFRSEVQRARQVPPFCTAEVLDADPDHEPPYLVVEYVEGPSLAEAVAGNGPLSPSNVHSIAVGVASALTAIHQAGVVHRDLKPENVLLAPGSPKVIDFGIAQALDGGEGFTRTGHVAGTPAYMAPERLDPGRGFGVGPAADIFAWGAVVVFAATGRSPFRAPTMTGLVTRIMVGKPELAGVPGYLRPLVAQALAKDPADRPTAHQIVNALLLRPPARRRRARRWVLQAALAATVLAGATFAGVALRHHFRNAPAPESPLASAPAPLVAELNGLCLDIRNGGLANPRAIQTLKCSGNPDQGWTWDPDGTLRALDECLDLTGPVRSGVAPVGLTACTGSPTQQWRYTQGREIVSVPTGRLCLEIAGSAADEGADLQARTCRNAPNQRWTNAAPR